METLPQIRVQGCNAYDTGVSVGAHFATMIHSRIAKHPDLNSALLPFAASEPGERLIQSLSTSNRYCNQNGILIPHWSHEVSVLGQRTLPKLYRERYPRYWDELRGLADGSGVPFLESNFDEKLSVRDIPGSSFLQVLLLNFRKEIASFLPEKAVSKSAQEADNCSDVLLCHNNLAVIAHNEDADGSVSDHVYIVHATLETGTSFFAYTYAGELPSCAFGFNSHGVAFTVNAVPPAPEEVVPGGIGRNFVCRDLLEALDLNDAVHRIKSANLSVGHNYNVMDLNLQKILTIEAASRGRSFVHEIRGEPFFHANMYLHLLEVRQIPHESSIHRQKRAAELPQLTQEDMLTLLGDTSDQAFPVYMEGPIFYTLHTVVFNLHDRTMTVYRGNPTLQSTILQISMQL